jgi:hypothetical protein
MRWCLILLAGLFALDSPAAPPPQWPTWPQVEQASEQFAYDRLRDGQRLVLGPSPPRVAPVPANQTCAELYAQRLALMQTQVDYKPAFTDDPRNRAAIFVGTLFPPAFFYLAFSGIQAYGDANDDAATQAQLDALRYASATQQCFVR